MSDQYQVSSNPHIRSRSTTGGIMMAVILALLPATGFGIYNFGTRAALVITVTISAAIITEYPWG